MLQDGEQVQRVVSDGVIATVTTSKSTHKARSVILAAGPWTSRLTETLGLSLPLQVYLLDHNGVPSKLGTSKAENSDIGLRLEIRISVGVKVKDTVKVKNKVGFRVRDSLRFRFVLAIGMVLGSL